MNRKKKIMLAVIVLIWISIIIILMRRKDETAVTAAVQGMKQKAPSGRTEVKAGEYPSLSLALTRADLFASLYNAAAEKKNLAERKKVLNMAAPPMPILPGDAGQKKEEAVDALKDVSLLGIVEKSDKKMSFFRKNKDIKSYNVGEKVFETPYVIETIGSGYVTLVGPSGDRKNLEITKDKEVKK